MGVVELAVKTGRKAERLYELRKTAVTKTQTFTLVFL
jgi:hypothetical protein